MTTSLLDHYRALERAGQQMLESARARNWSEVADLRQTCGRLIVELKQAALTHPLQADEQIERLQVMRRIVQMEGEVRRLSSPANAWLDRMFARQSATA